MHWSAVAVSPTMLTADPVPTVATHTVQSTTAAEPLRSKPNAEVEKTGAFAPITPDLGLQQLP
ncbi:MAG: hypothetical protein OEM60_15485, partial [Gammaproteobacteria bacterium]|nr:hypothetical protein [Gammaproteobacteria bacterium]